MHSPKLKKCRVRIKGTHCASCEVLIEREFKKIPGVEKVNVNHVTGEARLQCHEIPDVEVLSLQIQPHGYTALPWEETPSPSEEKKSSKHYFEIGGVFLLVVAAYLILRQFDLIPKSLSITDNMSYGIVFLIGLVAAMSTCIAVTGGLLLAVASKYNELNPGLSGVQKFKPHIFFNIGRIVSYTILGGAVGALGSIFTLSPVTNGILTIVASLVMILLGLQLLKLFPRLGRFQPHMPKFLANPIHNLASSQNRSASFLLGAGTFFLPCGFTQALQLYVLSQGSFTKGALTMLIFSLGTLPALVSLGAITSFAKGAFQRYFLKFAGVVVILVGVLSVRNGFALTGLSASLSAAASASRELASGANKSAADKTGKNKGQEATVPIIDGRQIAEMKVKGLKYEPSQFTVVKGIPVEWRVDGREAGGCASVLTAGSIGITEYLPKDSVSVIEFTPTTTGKIPFSCSMGMTTRGAAFKVIENTASEVQPQNTVSPDQNVQLNTAPQKLDVTPPRNDSDGSPSSYSGEIQKVSMAVTREKGFWPPEIEVKKSIPVELTMDVQVDLGGCMSTAVIPDYKVTQLLKLGENKITFTPTETGKVTMMCPMGVKMGTFNVIES